MRSAKLPVVRGAPLAPGALYYYMGEGVEVACGASPGAIAIPHMLRTQHDVPRPDSPIFPASRELETSVCALTLVLRTTTPLCSVRCTIARPRTLPRVRHR